MSQVQINTDKTEYYNWPLVVAYLESWVRKQSTPQRENVYAAKCWSYLKATIHQEVENHVVAGVDRDMALGRVWEMFEAACRGQPLVEMGQVMVNLTWIGQSCTHAEWNQFFVDLEQIFAAVHRTTNYFTLPVEYRQGSIDFIDTNKELMWKRNPARPVNLPIIHPKTKPVDPFDSSDLLEMILALPQSEFEALNLPHSIRNLPREGTRGRRKVQPASDYDPDGLIFDNIVDTKPKGKGQKQKPQSKRDEKAENKAKHWIMPQTDDDEFH